MSSTAGSSTGRSSRLSAVVGARKPVQPWQFAERLKPWFLYWLPVSSFPVRLGQREWLLQFSDRLTALLESELGLTSKQFLDPRNVPANILTMLRNRAFDMHTMPGLTRRAADYGKPCEAVADQLPESGDQGPSDPDPGAQLGFSGSFWFPGKNRAEQRRLFLGFGGMTVAYMAPDLNAQGPSFPFSAALRSSPMFSQIFETFDVEGMHAYLYTLRDRFLANSKRLASDALPLVPYLRGALYVLPALRSADFFEQPAAQIAKFFELFDVYLRESPDDDGVILASKTDLGEALAGLVEQMQSEHLTYPEG